MADDGTGDAFRRALDEALRAQSPPSEEKRARIAGAKLDLCFDLPPTGGRGGKALWDLATEWTDDPASPRAPPTRWPMSRSLRDPAGAAEAIAQELGFSAGLTAEALAARWRAFVWRNHPDRQPAHARERANARVAVANALYDLARCALRSA